MIKQGAVTVLKNTFTIIIINYNIKALTLAIFAPKIWCFLFVLCTSCRVCLILVVCSMFRMISIPYQFIHPSLISVVCNLQETYLKVMSWDLIKGEDEQIFPSVLHFEIELLVKAGVRNERRRCGVEKGFECVNMYARSRWMKIWFFA